MYFIIGTHLTRVPKANGVYKSIKGLTLVPLKNFKFKLEFSISPEIKCKNFMLVATTREKNVESPCIKLTDHAIEEANLTTVNIYFVVGSYPV